MFSMFFRNGLFAHVLLILWPGLVSGQRAVLKGVVTHAQTHEAVPFATAYLASTRIGTQTTLEGKFNLTGIPPGKYDFTVSCVGFKTFQQPVEVGKDTVTLNVSLTEDVRLLKEVVIHPKPLNIKHWRSVFIRYFVGHTQQALACKVTNMEKLDLFYDDESLVFEVTCPEPVIVENRALGYRIFYDLQAFRVDYRHNTLLMGGYPRFEELAARDKYQERQWERARQLAYYGSVMHFFRSYKKRQLGDEHFIVTLDCDEGATANPYLLFGDSTRTKLHARCPINIDYQAPSNLWQKAPPRLAATVTLLDSTVSIFENGYYENAMRVKLDGDYYNQNSLSLLLPLDYEP